MSCVAAALWCIVYSPDAAVHARITFVRQKYAPKSAQNFAFKLFAKIVSQKL
jgi:hypothetical protein